MDRESQKRIFNTLNVGQASGKIILDPVEENFWEGKNKQKTKQQQKATRRTARILRE